MWKQRTCPLLKGVVTRTDDWAAPMHWLHLPELQVLCCGCVFRERERQGGCWKTGLLLRLFPFPSIRHVQSVVECFFDWKCLMLIWLNLLPNTMMWPQLTLVHLSSTCLDFTLMCNTWCHLLLVNPSVSLQGCHFHQNSMHDGWRTDRQSIIVHPNQSTTVRLKRRWTKGRRLACSTKTTGNYLWAVVPAYLEE